MEYKPMEMVRLPKCVLPPQTCTGSSITALAAASSRTRWGCSRKCSLLHFQFSPSSLFSCLPGANGRLTLHLARTRSNPHEAKAPDHQHLLSLSQDVWLQGGASVRQRGHPGQGHVLGVSFPQSGHRQIQRGGCKGCNRRHEVRL